MIPPLPEGRRLVVVRGLTSAINERAAERHRRWLPIPVGLGVLARLNELNQSVLEAIPEHTMVKLRSVRLSRGQP